MMRYLYLFYVVSFALQAQTMKCFDVGDASGNHIYESHLKGMKELFQCENTISQCADLKTKNCKPISDELLKYIRFIEIKEGFLLTQSCFDEGIFHDCPLIEYHDNKEPLVLVDKKGTANKLDLQGIKASVIDKLILKRNITVQGHYLGESDVIKVEKIYQNLLMFKNCFGMKNSEKNVKCLK